MDTSKTPFLDAVSSNLPDGLSEDFRTLCNTSNNDQLLDNIIRFICGGGCTTTSQFNEEQWITRQTVVRNRLSALVVSPSGSQKRARDTTNDLPDTQNSGNKRQKNDFNEPLAADDPPVFTLKSVSVASPVRKKVVITIHNRSIRFHNTSTNALEHSVSVSSLRRGFLVPTRGKTKPHWTIILISSDAPPASERSSKGQPSAAQNNLQVIFGLDASATTAMTTTEYFGQGTTLPKETTIRKGEETLPLIHSFLSRLPFQTLEPSIDVFKSAFPGVGGTPLPGVEAYRGAKPGSLWFMKEGILWGEAKPCEFWPVEELLNKSEGLRIISATGRTLTIILTRVGREIEDGEAVKEESQFGPVDAKEQDAIHQWVREYRHLFGKRGGGGGEMEIVSPPENKNPTSSTAENVGRGKTLNQAQFDSEDEEDQDFQASSEDDSGSNSSSDEDGEGDGHAVGEDEEEEEEDAEGDEVEEEELKPENHPLLRPGAMPKMSRAAMDMVVDMVEGDLARASGVGARSDVEEDELDD
ncbi:hypothetical protein E1B28_013382 [Marasmius oreades]|uniref:Histone chaperone RTT106/FACT complex subunit SPT16-like middle domain-containing protein n=1 Tax=Marasmius oreades TaxID=181124 RepID=A0A9P7RPN5_9AGAR|nr:uncharacterized protein E1B28_013382 [Marasmius oreades]KAG7087414.1 hypothetical protein E1B28_013382 [Marasmius oreades]